MSRTPFHLGWFLQGSSAQGWGLPFSTTAATDWAHPELMIDLARAMERAKMDYILLEDAPYVGDMYGGSMDVYLRTAMATPRQDPVVVSTLLLAATSRLGVCTTLPTYGLHPYPLARAIGTLDQISRGRSGWNMVTGNSVRAAQNFGLAELAEHDLRYEMADEFMAAVYALWDSWEPDAIVADLDSGLFADPAKVHRVDFEGEWFRTRGPLNSGPAPQGRPVIAQAGASPRGRQFAAQHADTIVGAGRTASAMKAYRDDVRARAERIGRNPDEIKVLFNIMPIIGATERDAAERMDILRARAQAQPELHLAALSKLTNNDLSVFPMDEPLDPAKLSTNGSQWGLPQFIEQNEGRTLREAAVIGAMSFPGAGGLVGTPAQVAGRMSEMMDEAGGDGFLIVTDELNRRTIAELTEGLVPELQRLGVVRREYEHAHLRDTLREF